VGAVAFALTAPCFAIESAVHGVVVDTSVGSNIAGFSLMGELGVQWAGIHSDEPGRWIVNWDLLAAFRAGLAVTQPAPNFLLGAHAFAWGQLGLRTTVSHPWSPYIGGRLGGDLLVMAQPGVSLSALNTLNNLEGVAGVLATGVVGVEAGASLLQEQTALRMVAILQESLHSKQAYTPSLAFTDVGVGARYDVSHDLTAWVEFVVGLAPTRTYAALGYTDQAFHGQLELAFRKMLARGMWFDVVLFAERYFDKIVYTPGATYTTADPFTFGFTFSFGFPAFGGCG